MDFVKFWQLVERHPWLLRIIVAFDEMLKDPGYEACETVLYFLTPSAIANKIKYMAFRPWDTLDLTLCSVGSHLDSREGGRHEMLRNEVYFVCYWHKQEAEVMSSSVTNYAKDDISVGQLLEEVCRQGGKIDLVVRVIEIQNEEGVALGPEPREDHEKLLTSIFESFQAETSCHSFSYEMFMPPNSDLSC